MTPPEPKNSKFHPGYFLIAALLIGILFFDVVFLGASFAPSNIAGHIGPPENFQLVSMLDPDHAQISPSHGYSDIGATAWQGEPARHFMARSLAQGELPRWNPYSANGSLAAETLADQKFSVLTLLPAFLFNASTASFDLGLILLFVIGAYSLLCISQQYFKLNMLPSLLVVLVFYLNGFASANYSSQNAQAYFLAPLLLLSILQWSQQRTIGSWIWMTVCHALMFLITMLPVMVLTLVTCHLIHLAWWKDRHKDSDFRHLAKTGYGLLACGVGAFLLTAFFWIPVLINLPDTSLFKDYGERGELPYLHWHNLLSIVSPKHFWESYNGIRPLEQLSAAAVFHDWGVLVHLGLGCLMISSAAVHPHLLRKSPFASLLLLLLLLCFIPYLRIFGQLAFLDDIPFFKIIGRQYWGCMSSLAFCFLAGFGLQQLQQGKTRPWFVLVVLSFFCWNFFKLYQLLGWPETGTVHALQIERLSLFFVCFFVLFMLWFVVPGKRAVITAAIFLGAVTELFLYINHLRPVRYNPTEHPPEFVKFLQQNIGNYRVFNIGGHRTLQAEFGSMYGIRQTDSMNSSLLPWYQHFYQTAFGTENLLFLTIGTSVLNKDTGLNNNAFNLKALNLAGAKYVVVSPGARFYAKLFEENGFPLVYQSAQTLIFENPHARPIVYFSNRWKSSNNLEDIQESHDIITQDERLIGLLKRHQINQQPLCPAPRIINYTNNEVRYQTQCEFANILATNDVWHSGWRASIDGQTVPLGMINTAFRGLLVPAGSHEIHLRYAPVSLVVGNIISLLFGIVMGLIGFFAWYKTKTSRAGA